MRRLFVSVRERDQLPLRPRRTDEGNADRQTERLPRGNRYAGIPGYGRGRRARAGEVIAVDQIGGPGRAARRRNDRVEAVLRQDEVDALGTRQRPAPRQGGAIHRRGQGRLLLSRDEELL